jgi:pimeloyl-ACP methyl ester carboxylesterase
MRLHPVLLGLCIASALGACATPRVAPPVVPIAATARTDTGVLEGARYRIDVPANWNGELVMYAHGYEPVGSSRPGPLRQGGIARALLADGYAVAASAYSAEGWAVAEGIADTERLRRHASAFVGTPRRTWLVGASMGAQVALALGEMQPRTYAGVLSLCGVNAPAGELFADGVLAPLLAFDHLFPGVLPDAPNGLADPTAPPMVDMGAIAAALASREADAQRLAQRFDIPREGLADSVWLYYLVLREAAARAGGFPVDNRDTRYVGFGDDDAFNATVERHAGDPRAIAYVRANAGLTGKTRIPVVLQSNDADPTVPTRFGDRYAALANAAGAGRLVTNRPRVGQGHCDFEDTDIRAAMAQLSQQRAR